MFSRSLAVLFLVRVISSAGATAGPVRSIRPDDATRTSMAVEVDGSANLVHTAQLLPVGSGNPAIARDRVDEQAEALLDRLESTLKEARSSIDKLVKVDVYLARPDARAPFLKAFARRMADRARPAISYVIGALSRPEAVVALDAVAVTALADIKPNGRFAVLPAGPRLYVSGQADPDVDLAVAARKTLLGLESTLKYVGLDRSRVVRLKAFMQPMTPAAVAVVEHEVSAFFEGRDVPPLCLVEWRSSPRQPVEIELVAADREAGRPPVEYLAPPGRKPSPVFSRAVRTGAGPLIYVSGLYGAAGASGTDQVEAIFATLAGVLTQAGSDFRHLVKATYYVSDDAASSALNDVRLQYFDPNRPPAASKAFVAGVGLEGRAVTLDMIAVPAEK